MVFADCANALLIGSVPVAALPLLVGRARLTAATSALYGPATVVGIVAPGVAPLLPWLSRRLAGPWIALLIGPLSAVFLLLCWSVSYATVAANNIIFRQSRTPEPLLSRVNTSGRILASGAGTSLGALIGGAVADAAGVGWAIATGAGFAALSALIGWLSPLRREPLRAA